MKEILELINKKHNTKLEIGQKILVKDLLQDDDSKHIFLIKEDTFYSLNSYFKMQQADWAIGQLLLMNYKIVGTIFETKINLGG